MDAWVVKHLKAFEHENARLERRYANVMLDRAVAAPFVRTGWRGRDRRVPGKIVTPATKRDEVTRLRISFEVKCTITDANGRLN